MRHQVWKSVTLSVSVGSKQSRFECSLNIGFIFIFYTLTHNEKSWLLKLSNYSLGKATNLQKLLILQKIIIDFYLSSLQKHHWVWQWASRKTRQKCSLPWWTVALLWIFAAKRMVALPCTGLLPKTALKVKSWGRKPHLLLPFKSRYLTKLAFP